MRAEQRRNVDARDLGQEPEQVLPRRGGALPARHRVADLVDDLLALADDEGVEEIGHRLRIVGAGSAAEDERIVPAAIL